MTELPCLVPQGLVRLSANWGDVHIAHSCASAKVARCCQGSPSWGPCVRPVAAAACLRASAEAGCVLAGAGWQGRPYCTMYIKVCAPRNATCLNLAKGAKVGSITVPAPALPTFARPSCLSYTLPPLCPGHVAIAVRAARSCMAWCHPERGWLRSAARPHANSFAAAAAAALCLSLHTGVAHTGTVVEPLSTPMATTTQHALEPDCSPAEQSPSSMHGCASCVRLSDPRARASHSSSSGWRARQPVMLTPPIAAASTLLSCTGPLRLARRCVAT